MEEDNEDDDDDMLLKSRGCLSVPTLLSSIPNSFFEFETTTANVLTSTAGNISASGSSSRRTSSKTANSYHGTIKRIDFFYVHNDDIFLTHLFFVHIYLHIYFFPTISRGTTFFFNYFFFFLFFPNIFFF